MQRRPKDIMPIQLNSTRTYQDTASQSLGENTYRSNIDSFRSAPPSNTNRARLQQDYLNTPENEQKEPGCFEFLNKFLEKITNHFKPPPTSPKNSPKQSNAFQLNRSLNQDDIIL
jgi:hypothetical protein